MNIVVITRPECFDGEVSLILRMFDMGLPLLHLRKPNVDVSQVEQMLDAIPVELRCRVVLHDNFELAAKYCVGGLHLNSRNPLPPADWCGRLSRSCHSLSELVDEEYDFDYQFLSPIFDSVSKSNYKAKFSAQVLQQALEDYVINPSVYALSGITLERLPHVMAMGFGGAAILGEVWNMAQRDKIVFNDYFSKLSDYF